MKVKDLEKRYNQAVKNNERMFKLHGLEFVTGYAKYLLEYLKMKGVEELTFTQDKTGHRSTNLCP